MGTKKEGSNSPSRREDNDLRNILEELGVEVPTIIQNHRGKEMLSPLYLARIAERIQFDGDLPELRFGPLPLDAKPAVPVDADVFSSKALGVLLQRASEEVKDSLEAAQNALNDYFQKEGHLMEVDGDDLTRMPQVPGASVQGYAPASAPAFRKMELRSGELQSATKKTIWQVLATTQGRKSVADILEKRFEKQYKLEPTDEEQNNLEDRFQWTIRLNEVSDYNPNFDVIPLVHRVFARRLENIEGSSWSFRVVPINRIHERIVGWECRIYRKQEESGH